MGLIGTSSKAKGNGGDAAAPPEDLSPATVAARKLS